VDWVTIDYGGVEMVENGFQAEAEKLVGLMK